MSRPEDFEIVDKYGTALNLTSTSLGSEYLDQRTYLEITMSDKTYADLSLSIDQVESLIENLESIVEYLKGETNEQ